MSWLRDIDKMNETENDGDTEFLRHIGRMYEEMLRSKKNSKFIINAPQMQKLMDVLDYFIELIKDCKGQFDDIDIAPEELHVGITATFIAFGVHGAGIQKFCDVMSNTSAMGMDATEDGVCISVTVPNVFMEIKEVE